MSPVKFSWSSVGVPVVAAGVASALVSLPDWADVRTALLPAISVIAAAVLVRLARGLPFTNADHFTLNEFRPIASMLEANARKLRALIFVCLIAMAGLIVLPSLSEISNPIETIPDWFNSIGKRGLSAALAGSIAYAFTRVIEVVHSDVSLLRLQARTIELAIAGKNATSFVKSSGPEVRGQIAGKSQYGAVIK